LVVVLLLLLLLVFLGAPFRSSTPTLLQMLLR
jgi:hypothetical protein